MDRYLSSVKNKNVEKVINALCEYRNLSKKGLVEKTGLSINTIAKILSKMEEHHLVSSYSRTAKFERKPNRIFRINNRFFSVIYILNDDYFYAFFTKANSVIIDAVCYTYNKSMEFELNMKYFRRRVFHRLPSSPKNCIACILMLPGMYNKELDIVRPTRIPGMNILTVSDIKAQLSKGWDIAHADYRIYLTEYSSSKLADNETALVIFMFNNEFSTTIVNNATHAEVSSFSPVYFTSGKTKIPMHEKFDDSKDVFEQIDAISDYITNIIEMLPITDVHIFGNYYKDLTDFNIVISEKLSIRHKRPIVINRNISDTDFISFIGKKLRIKHFIDFIFNKEVDK